jgi:hypothetical protein
MKNNSGYILAIFFLIFGLLALGVVYLYLDEYNTVSELQSKCSEGQVFNYSGTFITQAQCPDKQDCIVSNGNKYCRELT